MPVFEYKALDNSGKQINGTIEASSLEDARSRLRKNNVYTTFIKLSNKATNTARKISFSKLFKMKGTSEISLITRQLSTLISADVPLIQSLAIVEEQIEDENVKKIMIQVKERVLQGFTLADALLEHPKVFNNIYVNMVRAGENSGTLAIILDRLADFTEKQNKLKNKIQSVLYYPIFMAVIGTGVLIFLLSYVVPKVTAIFIEAKRTLPLITRILISASDILKVYWWLLILIIAAIIISIKQFMRTEKGRIFFDGMKLNLPIFGDLAQEIIISRFCRTLGTLITSGIPILKALEIAENVTDNKVISESIKKSHKSITAGNNISSPLKQSGFFPPLVTHMIAIGEQSGQLEKMLIKIADIYDSEVEMSVNVIMSFLEPVIIVIMGIIVGVIILAILLPIFDLSSMA